MKYSDVVGLADKELVKKANEIRKQLFEARMKNALGQLGNSGTIREMRKDIARLQTALTAKIRAAVGAGAPVKKKATKTSKRSATAGRAKKAAAKKG